MKTQKARISELSEEYTSAIKRKRESREREGPEASGISILNLDEEQKIELDIDLETPDKPSKHEQK